ncbi:uncharacterized protein LOC110862652 [Folsomia candida]|uniref:uncharacterized protein LOC110862652 n=1 Tax=Folsomia candida TaxID=158441 RepID=UPI001604E547|nr:uncharacterized protein LOC110862652 [Folsomia candida]
MSSMISVEEEIYRQHRGWKYIKDVIKQRHGTPDLKSLQRFEKLKIKQSQISNNIIFLKQCKRNYVIPKGLRLKNPIQDYIPTQVIVEKASQQLVKSILGKNYKDLQNLDKLTNNLSEQLNSKFQELWMEIQDILVPRLTQISTEVKTREKLLDEKMSKNVLIEKQPTFINLSKRKLNQNEEELLNLGLNYAVPPSKPNHTLIETAINIEKRLQDIDNGMMHEIKKNSIRTGASQIIRSNKSKTQIPPSYFKKLIPSIKSLKNDNSIVILPADKGNCTVIMDRFDYEQKCLTMLTTSTYTTRTVDPSPYYEKKIGQMCLKMKKEKKLSEHEYRTIVPRQSLTPVFYGLPKIHKKDVPLRPIVDFKNSPSFHLASHLNIILKSISKKTYAVKNSYEFVDRLNKVKVKPGYILGSFDVTSLYTNVPQQHTINYIKQRLKEEKRWKQITNLEEIDILEMLNLCLECNYFLFRGNLYYQNDGVPMGSPVSPIFADLFMESLEENIVPVNPFISYWNSEHRRDLRNMTETSAIVQHINNNPTHQINFADANIIHFEPRYFARKFKEGLYINAEQRSMNQNDGIHINPIWTPTLLPLL